MSKNAQLCPVCLGSGKYYPPSVTVADGIACHGCGGKGWVEIGQDDIPYCPTPPVYPYYPYSWYYITNPVSRTTG